MEKKTEGICIGLFVAMVAILVLNIFPGGMQLLPQSSLRKMSEKPLNKLPESISGLTAKSIVFASSPKDSVTVIMNSYGTPILRVDGMRFISWSPKEDVALLENTNKEGGFRLIDMKESTLGKNVVKTMSFGHDMLMAKFSKNGSVVHLENERGSFKRVSTNMVLRRTTNALDLAMFEEE
jgi:hypothetical protein